MSDPFSFEGKVALVTGGARGIGRAITEELQARGAAVVIADSGVSINGDPAEPTAADQLCHQLGTRTASFAEDIAAPGQAEAAVKLAIDRFGAIDIVINNAAILRDAFIFKSNRGSFERVLRTNLIGAYAVLAAATPWMREAVKRERTPGRIVNIVSTAGLYGNLGQSAYAAAKAGLFGMTRVVAMDLARSKINCNAVAPFAATRVTESIEPANDLQAAYKSHALQVPAAYVARVVAWLSSPSCDVTGQLFGVRGRELFLFSQPRPIERIVTAPLAELTVEAIDAAVSIQMRDKFFDLTTDLESFSNEPLI
ncbi:MAG: 3-hydroxyacyl-CoA dehydrogenase [Proteobacteria bacterium]|nr:MAG: 3-hydroxyacyl-CoA dehydrogenase [Pseudomonadota bacterium]